MGLMALVCQFVLVFVSVVSVSSLRYCRGNVTLSVELGLELRDV